ncbi:MAG: hypothetical protein R2912_12335 [Eubacteriales bacterium]
MAFQIIDDCLDYLGMRNRSARMSQTTSNRAISLPLLMALRNEPTGTLHELVFQSSLTQEDIARIGTLVIEHNGVALAEERGKGIRKRCADCAFKIKKSESRNILEKIM